MQPSLCMEFVCSIIFVTMEYYGGKVCSLYIEFDIEAFVCSTVSAWSIMGGSLVV